MLNFLARWWAFCRAEWQRLLLPTGSPTEVLHELSSPETRTPLEPLQRITISDEVSRTLFQEYAEHRAGQRGEEETGWVLMGHREGGEAIILATLPAGALREAGVAHVRFNAEAQALASRILRQGDRKLTILGIVHTHPGTLRHPSKGDFHGDKQWVRLLRGHEGIFAIGTADGSSEGPGEADIASQPEPHVQIYEGLRFTWYSLGLKDKHYRPLPVQLTLGPDLALPLHAVWPALEVHAARLERVWQQLTRLRFEIRAVGKENVLQVCLSVGDAEELRVLLQPKQVTYALWRKGELFVSSLQEPAVDRGIYLLLAELAKDKAR
jgi:proteasome lid subunit RPN8/RPN11